MNPRIEYTGRLGDTKKSASGFELKIKQYDTIIFYRDFKNKTSNSFEFSTYSIFVATFGLFSTIVIIDGFFRQSNFF